MRIPRRRLRKEEFGVSAIRCSSRGLDAVRAPLLKPLFSIENDGQTRTSCRPGTNRPVVARSGKDTLAKARGHQSASELGLREEHDRDSEGWCDALRRGCVRFFCHELNNSFSVGCGERLEFGDGPGRVLKIHPSPRIGDEEQGEGMVAKTPAVTPVKGIYSRLGIRNSSPFWL